MCITKSQPVSSNLLNEMAIQLETLFTFVVLIVGCISLNVVNGNSNTNDEIYSNVESNDVGFGDFPETILTAEQTSTKHSSYTGCKKGYCWKWCNGADDGKWCFTTDTYTDSYDFVPCISDSDCDSSLKCGGPCRINLKLKKVLHHLKRLEYIKSQSIRK